MPFGVTGDFSLWYHRQNEPCALRSTQPLKRSSRDFSWVNAAGAFCWRPTTLVVLKRKEIRGLNPPGTPWATSACRGRHFILSIYISCVCVVFKVIKTKMKRLWCYCLKQRMIITFNRLYHKCTNITHTFTYNTLRLQNFSNFCRSSSLKTYIITNISKTQTNYKIHKNVSSSKQ